MKYLKKIAVVALAALLLPVTGCGGDTPQSEKPLKVGMELAYPPFETKNGAGEPEGISVDLAKELGKSLGREVEISNIAWDGLIPSLSTGKVDVIISSMTITEKRKKVVNFSDPYANAYLALLVSDKSPVKSTEDLNKPSVTFAVKKGTTGATYVAKTFPKAKITALSSENAAVTEVVQGKADAFIYDQLTIYRQSKKHPGKAHAMALADQKPEQWGMAYSKKNEDLGPKLNKFIADFKANGGFDKLTQKHLAEEKKTFDSIGFPWFF